MKRSRELPQAARLVLGLGALVIVGTALLMLPASSSGHPLPLSKACFTAISALATTGLSLITPGSDLSLFGQIVLLALMQIGGIGFMIGSVLIFRLLGARVTVAERFALRDALGAVSAGSAVRVAQHVIQGVLFIEIAGALLLWLLWVEKFGPVSAAYLAAWHAVSAFTNSSFDLFSGSPIAPAGFPSNPPTLLVISGLVILGSIGIPVLGDLLGWIRRGHRRYRFSLHTKVTLATAAGLMALGTLALFAGSSLPGTLFSDATWSERLIMSYFHAATARTSGFVLVPMDQMSQANSLVLCLLMFIGGSPASMGGGIGTSTFLVLILTMTAHARGQEAPRAWGRVLPHSIVSKAVAILASSLVFVLLVTWLLLLTQSTTLVEALFEAISAFATCGFTLGLTPRLDGFGQALIAFTMFSGRLGILTLVVALTAETTPSPIAYPEEKILIG
jgi:trk system potassium uptake protein TrkH